MSMQSKLCKGGCGKYIYWDDTAKQYKEQGTQQKHFCPNYKKSNTNTSNTNTNYSGGYKKPFIPKQKEPVECSVIVCSGREQYEKLSDLITAANGRIHGTQHHIDEGYTDYDFIVYFEVPVGRRSELIDKFNEI